METFDKPLIACDMFVCMGALLFVRLCVAYI